MILLLSFFVGLAYVGIISAFFWGWETLPTFEPTNKCSTKVSIIIAMRNEALSIERIINDLLQQDFQKELLEIIIIDDNSTDRSLEIAQKYASLNFRIYQLPFSKSGKKAALLHGIEKSCGQLIVTTDADCRIRENWIKTMVSFYEKTNSVLILGPVRGIGKGFWYNCLSVEQYALQGSTAGAAKIQNAIMCNGANFAFSKNIFAEIKHIYENDDIKSGDDMFVLMELKKKYKHRINYIKSDLASVYTEFPNNMKSFFKQRKRWAAKSVKYSDLFVISTGLIVFVTSFMLFFTFLYGAIFTQWKAFFLLFITKTAIDFLFLYRITSFYNEKRVLKWFLIVQSFYFFYVTFTVVFSLITSNVWKDRIIKK